MRGGLFGLAARRVLHVPVQSALLVVVIAVALAVPVTTAQLVSRYDDALLARARATPVVIGAPGSRVDLALAALYFDAPAPLDPLPAAAATELRATLDGAAIVVPLHLGATLRGAPIVATEPAYFDARDLACAAGTVPLLLGDVTLGAALAAELDLAVGAAVMSDPPDLHDLSRPAALRLTVSGVLAATGTPDDRAAFVSLNTMRVIDGAAHGHDDATTLDADALIGRAGDRIVVESGMVPANEVTDANRASFHVHGDARALPVTALLLFGATEKDATIISAREDARGDRLAIVPTAVVTELRATVFQVKQLFDALSVVLAASTIVLVALVIALDRRLRRRERETLVRLGCARSTALRLALYEMAALGSAALLIAAGIVFAALAAAPELTEIL